MRLEDEMSGGIYGHRDQELERSPIAARFALAYQGQGAQRGVLIKGEGNRLNETPGLLAFSR
jgi:hypothetical protein